MVATPVSHHVSNSRNQGPACIEPLAQEAFSPGLPFDAPPDDA
jgi:hypothetical protein